MHDIKDLVSTFFDCKIQYTNWLGNGAAHYLARYDWNVNLIVVWGGEVLDFASQVVWLDKQCL